MAKKYSVRGNGEFFVEEENGNLWAVPAEALHFYWKKTDVGNLDKDYLIGQDRSLKLVSLFDKYCSKDNKIIELGCNVGRNLHYLYKAGYKNLAGIDINQKALETGRKHYPNTIGRIELHCSALEDIILQLKEKSCDVVFTMAVLMHIHPTSIWMVRLFPQIANKFVITAELEDEFSTRVFPRNYKTVFENLGMKQLEEETAEFENVVDDLGKIKLTYRIFKHEKD